jgi:hypothetical protein
MTHTNALTSRPPHLRGLLALLLVVAASLCGCGVKEDDPTVGSETHWLQACEEDADCDDVGRCICRVCTVACDDRADGCASLPGFAATCQAPDAAPTLALCGDQPAPAAGMCLATCDGDNLTCADRAPGTACSAGVVCAPDKGDPKERCPVAAAPITDAPAAGCEDVPGATLQTLPGTGVTYCVKAHPDCSQAGADCMLLVTSGATKPFLTYVDDADRWGPTVVALSYGPTDGNAVKDWVAELPRVLLTEQPGISRDRVLFVGFSAGAGSAFRGQCSSSKGFDTSTYGTTSDLYAGIATMGGCPACSDSFRQLSGNFHVFAINSEGDQFAGDGCEDSVRPRAIANGCVNPGATWQPLRDDDPISLGLVQGQRLTFGPCSAGDVAAYRVSGGGHDVRSGDLSYYEVLWRWSLGRRKQSGGVTGVTACGL